MFWLGQNVGQYAWDAAHPNSDCVLRSDISPERLAVRFLPFVPIAQQGSRESYEVTVLRPRRIGLFCLCEPEFHNLERRTASISACVAHHYRNDVEVLISGVVRGRCGHSRLEILQRQLRL